MVQEISTSTGPATPAAKSVKIDERQPTAPGAARAADRTPRQADNDGRVGPVAQSNVQVSKQPNKPQTLRPGIQFNDDAARFVYLGINSSTQEVERQFPTEQELRQLAFFRDSRGVLIDEDA